MKLPRIAGSKLVRFLKKEGFVLIRIHGSHHFLRHADGRATVIPVHANETIGPGLLTKIIKKDLQLSAEVFLQKMFK